MSQPRFNKVASRSPANLLKKRLRHRSFFVKVFFYTFFTEQLPATSFEPYFELVKTRGEGLGLLILKYSMAH